MSSLLDKDSFSFIFDSHILRLLLSFRVPIIAVNGIDCVIKTSMGSVHSYGIEGGNAIVKGEGDLHDTDYDDFELSIVLTPDGLFSNSSAVYELFIYPNDSFFIHYSTSNPTLAMIGIFLTILLTSLFFFLYDSCVRSDIHAKHDLLQAKRNFIRFVSHEVRTPLNAVCMGLTMMEQELQSFITSSPDTTTHSDGTSEEGQKLLLAPSPQSSSTEMPDDASNSSESTKAQVMEWLSLTGDVLSSAQASVDVLSDILNYDKVQHGGLHLDLTNVDIWDLVRLTVREFELSAAAKNITLRCTFSQYSSELEKTLSVSLLDVPADIKEHVVVGDVVRITQVIRNVISNAIKFTPRDGIIEIDASWHPKDDYQGYGKRKEDKSPGSVQLSVTDTGAGMNEEQLSQLFTSGMSRYDGRQCDEC